jgi:hypothetical protein
MKGSRFTEEQIIGAPRAEANAYVERHRGERGDQQGHALVARNGEAQARRCATPTKSSPAPPRPRLAPWPPATIGTPRRFGNRSPRRLRLFLGKRHPTSTSGRPSTAQNAPATSTKPFMRLFLDVNVTGCRFFSYSCARDRAEYPEKSWIKTPWAAARRNEGIMALRIVGVVDHRHAQLTQSFSLPFRTGQVEGDVM